MIAKVPKDLPEGYASTAAPMKGFALLRAGSFDDIKAGGDSGGVVSGGFNRYNALLDKYPLATKMTTSAVLGGLSDVLVQTMSHKAIDQSFKLDFQRVLVFTTVCGLYFAPVVDAWFTFLAKIPFPAQLSDNGKVLAMLVVDQTVGAALVTGGFFYAFELAERLIAPSPLPYVRTIFEAGTVALRNNLIPTIMASWYCWPLVNFINFRYVPPQYRLLFTNIASIFWNMYLTGVANGK
eukprot:CAMPEP_0184990462 /NCGR_PEP_ID=MMETSP1098-20130426/32563_1 /TAXON_ID=89044 /ORGANISM="Spumella elongata, Strain CCAP 955/1" /LENGTH=236 /DNA_ID=CAMNT_0027515661 /DNA_START=122 /DNA_END=832 /DNA_ORIENTATION=+